MCYHASSPKVEKLSQLLGPKYKIFPYPELPYADGFAHPNLPVITNDDMHAVHPMIWWGVLPFNNSYTTLNFKTERLYDPKSANFKIAKTNRCIAFLQAMYEWEHKPGGKAKDKKPVIIYRNDNKPFAVGALWRWAKDEKSGEYFKTFSIGTTPANRLLQELRPEVPRMLLVLEQEQWEPWLSPETERQAVEELCKPYKDDVLKFDYLPYSPKLINDYWTCPE